MFLLVIGMGLAAHSVVNAVPNQVPESRKIPDVLGTRIGIFEAHDFVWEDDTVIISDEATMMGWQVEVNGGVMSIFERFEMPMFIDPWYMFYFDTEYTMDYEVFSSTTGNVRVDTIRSAVVVSERWLKNGERPKWDAIWAESDGHGTLVFYDDFCIGVCETVNEYVDDELVKKDSTWRFTPLFRNVRMANPNGQHVFQTKATSEASFAESSPLPDLSDVQYPLGTGGTLNRPFNPWPVEEGTIRSALKSAGGSDASLLSGLHRSPVKGAGRSTVTNDTVPVYIEQGEDGTISVFNLYGRSLVANHISQKPGNAIEIPVQAMFIDSTSHKFMYDSPIDLFYFNCSVGEDQELVPGNVGTITPDVISWGTTIPCSVNKMADVYYDNSQLYYTDGTQFVIHSEAPVVQGDLDGDGKVTITDITAMIDYLLNGTIDQIDPAIADVNHDGAVNIADITALIDMLLAGSGT